MGIGFDLFTASTDLTITFNILPKLNSLLSLSCNARKQYKNSPKKHKLELKVKSIR